MNTTFAGTLSSGTVSGSAPTTVLVAGDHAEAKQALISAVEAGGASATNRIDPRRGLDNLQPYGCRLSL